MDIRTMALIAHRGRRPTTVAGGRYHGRAVLPGFPLVSIVSAMELPGGGGECHARLHGSR